MRMQARIQQPTRQQIRMLVQVHVRMYAHAQTFNLTKNIKCKNSFLW